MSTKTLIYIGITVGGLLGGWLGSLLDHGNAFGAWGLLLSTLGGLAGIWAGYKVGTSIWSRFAQKLIVDYSIAL